MIAKPKADQRRKMLPGQFGISSILWLMATLGMALAYLRALDNGTEKIVAGLLIIGVALLAGLIVGMTAGRIFLAVYWSLLGAVFVFLFSLDVTEYHWSVPYVWGLVGTFAGAHAGVAPAMKPLIRMLAGGLAGGAVMGVFVIVYYIQARQWMALDLICAVIAGALLGAVVETIDWLERRFSLSRNFCAAGSTLAVILANLLLPRFLDL